MAANLFDQRDEFFVEVLVKGLMREGYFFFFEHRRDDDETLLQNKRARCRCGI